MSSSHFEDSVFTFLKISSNRDSNEMLKMLQKKIWVKIYVFIIIMAD